MLGVKPYISFKGDCRQAVEFYKEALNAEVLFMGTWGDSPMKGSAPDDMIMHCTMQIGDSHVMACDSPSEEHPVNIGNNISLAIGTDDVDSAQRMFDAMSAGGTVVMPMQETFWAERFGMLTDKFGINWMFNCEKQGADHSEATA
jgi:PhnB protein